MNSFLTRLILGEKKRQFLVLFGFFFVFFIGLYFRLFPALQNMHRADLETRRLMVTASVKRQIEENVSKEFGNIGADEKRRITSRRLRSAIEADRRNFDRTVRNVPPFRPRKFYLLGADPYYYYGLSKNLKRTGRLSENISKGEFFDPLMTAPLGHWRHFEVHPYTAYFLYTAADSLRLGISLMQAASVVPLILYLVCLILFFGACRMLGISYPVSLVSGLFFSLSPVFLQRSCIGWYDTDPYNVIFPMGILILLFGIFGEGHRISPLPRGIMDLSRLCRKFHFCEHRLYRRTVRSLNSIDPNFPLIKIIILAFFSALYSLFWQGWIFLPILTGICLAAYGIFRRFRHKNNAFLLSVPIFFIFTFSFTALMITPAGLLSSLSEVSDIVLGFTGGRQKIWPDIFLTVGELKRASPLKLMHLSGGPVFLFFSFLGLIFIMLKRRIAISPGSRFSLIIFTVTFFTMSIKAERFALFFIVPASILLALGIEFSVRQIRHLPLKRLYNKNINIYLISVFLSVITISPIIYANISAKRISPIFNDTWDDILKTIRTQTPADSIINTWWPPGHFIKAIGERGVTIDGATQNIPQSYWMSCFFMSHSEDEAVGILRMLNTSGNKAYEFLIEQGFDAPRAVESIKKVVALDKSMALKKAGNILDADKSQQFVSLTHGDIPPSFVLVYDDLVENKLGLYWASNWDFTRASSYIRDPSLSPGHRIRGTSANMELMWKISGGRPYIGSESPSTREQGDIISFDNGVILNTSTLEASIQDLEGEISGIPSTLLFPYRGQILEQPMPGADLNISVLFIKRDRERSSCIVAPSRVLRSVIFRMYYLNGTGLSKFRLFSKEEDPITNTRIMVYELL